MPRVTTINIFCVERILVRWVPEHHHYEIVIQGEADEYGETTISAWRGHGKEPAPELIVERAPEPVNPPNEEMDV